MKSIKEMTEKELTDWGIQKIRNGRDLRDIEYSLIRNNIDGNIQNSVLKTLKVIEKQRKRLHEKANEHAEKISLRNASLIKIFIGVFIGVFIAFAGWILWEKSVQAGVYFIFNFSIFIPAIVLIFKRNIRFNRCL